MIGYLRGRVLSLLPESVILDVGGVGYEVTCSGAAFSKLSGLRAGEEGEIYTYLQVGEQGVALFGFADLKEKELFLRLTSVQGVGAKLAIAALSSLRPADLTEAIYTADVKRLTAVKGLGKKTAELIVLNLREQLADEMSDVSTDIGGAMDADLSDAIFALVSLGVSNTEAVRAVQTAAKTASGVENIIAAALKLIG